MNWKDKLEEIMNGSFLELRKCSICNVAIGFKTVDDGFLVFDSACGCSERENLRHASLQEFRKAAEDQLTPPLRGEE